MNKTKIMIKPRGGSLAYVLLHNGSFRNEKVAKEEMVGMSQKLPKVYFLTQKHS